MCETHWVHGARECDLSQDGRCSYCYSSAASASVTKEIMAFKFITTFIVAFNQCLGFLRNSNKKRT